MQAESLPNSESHSLSAPGSVAPLHSERLNRLGRAAATAFDVPLIVIVDGNEQITLRSCIGSFPNDALHLTALQAFTAINATQVINDTLCDVRLADNLLVTDAPWLRFYVGHPLLASNGIRTGTLCVFDIKPREFTPDQLLQLACFANWAEAELFQETALRQLRVDAQSDAASLLSAQLQQMTTLNKIMAVAHSTLDSEATLQTICTELALALNAPSAGIARIDSGGASLTVIAGYYGLGRISTEGYVIELEGNQITQQVLSSRLPIAVPDIRHEPRMGTSGSLLLSLGIESILILPILVGHNVIGTLGLDWPSPRVFQPFEIELAQNVAHLVSQVLERNRLYEAAQMELAERSRAEAALRASESRLRALLNAMPDMLLQISRNGVWHLYRPGKGNEMLSPTTAHRRLRELLPSDQIDQLMDAINRAFLTGEMQVCELHRADMSGVVDFELRIVRFGEHDVLAVSRDITERKKMERMQAEFISMVSHELRTPLTSIRGALGLLANGVPGPQTPASQSMLDIALANSERLMALISDLLDIERIEAGGLMLNCQPIAVSELLTNAIAMNSAYAAEYGVDLQLKQSADRVMINADQGRLLQVLTNLISNAVKFSLRDSVVELSYNRNSPFVQILVVDTGMGIPIMFQKHAFEKFAQADSSDSRKQGGTGLGLSIAKAIIDRHGGTIQFVSKPSVGTTFIITLHEYPPQPQAAASSVVASTQQMA